MSGNKKSDRAIEALLTSSTIAEAAEKAKVCERTLYRWLNDSSFQQDVRDARRRLFSHGSGRVVALFAKAINVISDALDGVKVNKSAFLAAKLTIETVRAIEQDDLEARVERLEQTVHERDHPPIDDLSKLTTEQLEDRLAGLRRAELAGWSREDLKSMIDEMDSRGEEVPSAEQLRKLKSRFSGGGNGDL